MLYRTQTTPYATAALHFSHTCSENNLKSDQQLLYTPTRHNGCSGTLLGNFPSRVRQHRAWDVGGTRDEHISTNRSRESHSVRVMEVVLPDNSIRIVSTEAGASTRNLESRATHVIDSTILRARTTENDVFRFRELVADIGTVGIAEKFSHWFCLYTITGRRLSGHRRCQGQRKEQCKEHAYSLGAEAR